MNLDRSSFRRSYGIASATVASLAYGPATIESPLAHVFIQELLNARIVAFRGTKNPMDWLTDGKIKLVEYPRNSGLFVHAGFLESMLSVREPLLAELKALPPKPTIIGGHSKGGGEAREFIHSLTPDDAKAIGLAASHTFGEPRSIGRAASIAYEKQYGAITYRWVHEEDFIARVPWLCGRYRHAGHEVLLPSIGGYRIDPPIPFKLASDAYGLWKAYKARNVVGALTDLLDDHFIANYISAINLIPCPPLQGLEVTV